MREVEDIDLERQIVYWTRHNLILSTSSWGEPLLPGCPPAKPSGKISDTHSVGSICDHDLGVFTVTNIATENTDAVPPAHPVPRTPMAANQGLQRCHAPSVPLTRLAPLAAWQSLCTRHIDPHWKISLHWPSAPRTARAVVSRYFRRLASERSLL
jgi:hypothetical protein